MSSENNNNKNVLLMEDAEVNWSPPLQESEVRRRLRALGSGAEARGLFGRDFEAGEEVELAPVAYVMPEAVLPMIAPVVEPVVELPKLPTFPKELVRKTIFTMMMIGAIGAFAMMVAKFESSLSTHINDHVRGSFTQQK